MNSLERERLQRDHRTLDKEIEHAMAANWADYHKIQQLKKQKLAIKDRLYRIAHHDIQAADAA